MGDIGNQVKLPPLRWISKESQWPSTGLSCRYDIPRRSCADSQSPFGKSHASAEREQNVYITSPLSVTQSRMNRELSGRRVYKIDKMLMKCEKLTQKNYGGYIRELRQNARRTNGLCRKLSLSIDWMQEDTPTPMDVRAMNQTVNEQVYKTRRSQQLLVDLYEDSQNKPNRAHEALRKDWMLKFATRGNNWQADRVKIPNFLLKDMIPKVPA